MVLGAGSLMRSRRVRHEGWITMGGGLEYKRGLQLGPARCPRVGEVGDSDAYEYADGGDRLVPE